MRGLENQTLGKYELIREIGRGSMATVYLARDPFGLREVAIKVFDTRIFGDERIARRRNKLFFNEARAAGMLRHPNITATIDLGVQDSLRYIVMEYMPRARTLDRYCRPDRLLPINQAVEILLKCAIALDYAHRKGVIHRDIKPKNILLTQYNDVKLGDFGVVLLTGGDVDQTQVMGILGTPSYMSPEQIGEETITPQSDLFSLGLVAYELLTGVHPFRARTISAIAARIRRERQRPVRELRPDVPAALSRIVDRTLKKHPAGRYRTALDLAGDLSLVHDDMKMTELELVRAGKLEQLRRLSFFKEFGEAEVREVLNAAVRKRYAAGDTIIAEGEEDDAFYILLSGEVNVQRGELEVDVLHPGASFGEIGFILKRGRTATIVARTPVSVLRVRAAVIEQSSIDCQLCFQKTFLKSMAERLAAALEFISRSQV